MTKQIPLTKGKFALVDDDMFDYLNKWKWYMHPSRKTYYAAHDVGRTVFKKTIFMHRTIMNTPENMVTDHIDGDGLNNQKCNLRICTDTQNKANTRKRRDNISGYKGVVWVEKNKKWMAQITTSGQHMYLGYFSDIEQAAKAYDEAAKKYFGEFAFLNFPEN